MIQNTNGRNLQFTVRLAVPVAVAILTGVPSAQAQTWSQDWTYLTVSSGGLPRNLAIGGQDAYIFSSFGGVEGRTVLIDAESSDPVTPEWLEIRDDEPDYETMGAAAAANVFATLRVESNSASTTGKRAILSKYSSGSNGTPDWSRELPIDIFFGQATAVAVSDDGSRIVAMGYTMSGNTHVYEFSSNSSQWFNESVFQLGGMMDDMRASADAKRLYLRRGPRVRVADLQTGTLTLVASHLGTNFTGGHAISDDGHTIAYALQEELVVQQQDAQGNWSQLLAHDIDPLSEVCTALSLSADGSVMAAGIRQFDDLTSGILVLDTSTDHVRTNHSYTGSGSYSNGIGAVDISRNGEVAAIALWGDSSGVVPEAAVYDTTSGVTAPPIFTVDLPGSALSIDLSEAGTQLVVGSRTTHLGATGFVRGRIDKFSVGDGGTTVDPPPPVADFYMEGAGEIGEIVTFHFRPEGAGRAYLLVSEHPANTPITFGEIGTLYLARSEVMIYQYATFTEGDEVQMQFSMPIDPSLAGISYCFQGFSQSPRRLSTDWLQMTVQP